MDQKLKKDAGKLRYDLIPPEILTALAEIYTFGLSKGYEEESWRKVETKRYIASFMRHFNDWRMDSTGKDEESEFHHVKHLLWNAAALTMKTCYMNEEKKIPVVIKDQETAVRCVNCKFFKTGNVCGVCRANDKFMPK